MHKRTIKSLEIKVNNFAKEKFMKWEFQKKDIFMIIIVINFKI